LAQQLAGRVQELDERYAQPLSALEQEVAVFGVKVEGHLGRIGVVWK
jgi:type I restriction enzyme M protein